MTAINPLAAPQRGKNSPSGTAVVRDDRWHRGARWARWLGWVGLVFIVIDSVVGLWQGVLAGSVALTAWALSGVPEAAASGIVIWRFSGWRTLSDTAELRAQRGVAVSFWLGAPIIAVESIHHLLHRHETDTSLIGLVLTAAALLQMPLIGRAQQKLGARLASAATVGKGIQSYLCAAQAAAALIGLAAGFLWPDGWWLDPCIGLGIAAISMWQGVREWRGQDCGC